ncbi:MAG: Gfo/Idh/MocA family protein [Gemmataceae bacterium]
MQDQNVDRRDFLKTGAAAAAAGSAFALPAASYANIDGANNRIGIAFIGVGGRCQQHIGAVKSLQQANPNNVRTVAVCDVWDGDETLGRGRGRGLYPSARKCGLQADDRRHVTKDYRRILDLNEVDAVCIATPDHWHAKQSIDAMAAGKHVYCEKPMTKTIEEAQAIVAAKARFRKVMTVGVQSMADPRWRAAHEFIRRGNIGHVAQAQTSYYRNSTVGQWRYYPLKRETMTPQKIDWNMWLGTGFSVIPGVPLAANRPFDRAVWAQWRCYWDFGGGMFTDLFVHQTTHMIAAMGVRYPARVVGGGGIYLEYDGRDVPDVATVVADYNEGCQLIVTATMINNHKIEECIRGHTATVLFKDRTRQVNGRNVTERGFEVISQNIGNRPQGPGGQQAGNNEFHVTGEPQDDTKALWENFLSCCRANNADTLSTPELGAAAFTTVNMGVLSYRFGQALHWDAENKETAPANGTWASQWERRSEQRGNPNQILGWEGGNRGSTLTPPDYQSLEGPWVNGVDPAGNRTSTNGDS